MINNPIAWMSPDGKVSQTEGKLFYIPLYTAPKPLSDEEIAKIYHSENRFSPKGNFAYYGFARAIEERHGIK